MNFKILMFTFKALNGLAPAYITDLLTRSSSCRSLRSDDQLLLKVPRSHKATKGDRAFTVAGPRLWNKLPLNIKAAPTLETFKIMLKTHYFAEAYS